MTSDIEHALELIHGGAHVFEVRILRAPGAGTVSGYFDLAASAAKAVAPYDGKVGAIYVTLNPAKPDLLARASNRLKPFAKSTTADPDILHRRWLLLDFDPRRPSDISATDAEHEAALGRAGVVRDWLRERGWGDPFETDSGNGAHLLYAIDLPNDDASRKLIERVLNALALYHSDESVELDTTVGNAARITKLYGTVTCKGDSTSERPHRRSKILSAPTERQVVTLEQLETVAALLPATEQRAHANGHAAFDLEAWISRSGLPIASSGAWQGGTKWVFGVCPWNSDHTNRSAFVVQHASGAIAAGCHHNGCSANGWHDLRDVVEPGWRDTRVTGFGEAPCRYMRSDAGNAELFAAQHGDDVRFVKAWNRWLIWDGTRWAEDVTGEMVRRAIQTARSLYELARQAETEEERKAIAQHAIRTESAGKLQAMLTLAQAQLRLAAKPDDFDQDLYVINCSNGTVDLRTATLRPHRREDMITKVARAQYDSAAVCPTWIRFLDRVVPDRGIREFLQRWVGYCLTGRTDEHCMAILFGGGRNGKSVFVELLMWLLGDYARTASTETFLAKKQADGARNDLAALVGSRLVAASETGDGRRLDEAIVKQATGGDTVTARFLYAEFFDFTPQCKVMLRTNHKPIIRGTDDGIWSRIRLIPFAVKIPEAERDGQLLDKLRAEAAGIFNWAVGGAMVWCAIRDLRPPPAVIEATNEYRTEQDPIAGWLEQCCERDASAWANSQELYASYMRWCDQNGEHAVYAQTFGRSLAAHGFEKKPGTGGVRGWRGIRVAAVAAISRKSAREEEIEKVPGSNGNCGNSRQRSWCE